MPASPKKAATPVPMDVDKSKPLADPSVPLEEKHKLEESVPPAVLQQAAKDAGVVKEPSAPAPAADAAKSPAEAAASPTSPKTSSAKKRKAPAASPREGVRRSARLR